MKAVPCGQRLQGLKGIGDLYQPGVFARIISMNHGRQGAGIQGLLSEGITIEILALEGKEKLTRLQGTGIGIHAGRAAEKGV